MPRTARSAINSENALKQGRNGHWTQDRVEILRQRWNAGALISDIASELGCTKNSVIGKADRIGLARRNPADYRPRPGTDQMVALINKMNVARIGYFPPIRVSRETSKAGAV